MHLLAIAIFVSTVPNTLQPILKPLNKIGTFIFRSFLVFEMFQLIKDFSETLIELSLSLLNPDAKYLPCMNLLLSLDFRLRGCLESIISYASRLTINRTMAA